MKSPAAGGVGKATTAGYGRKPGFLFSFTSNPYGVVAIQLLDGVAAGIFGVIAILIASDLMRGTGRFNLAQGLVALCVGIGAGLSNLIAGFVVQYFGYPAGFLFLAAIAVGALIFFSMLMPETKQHDPNAQAPVARGKAVLTGATV
jgi:MFS family permease